MTIHDTIVPLIHRLIYIVAMGGTIPFLYLLIIIHSIIIWQLIVNTTTTLLASTVLCNMNHVSQLRLNAYECDIKCSQSSVELPKMIFSYINKTNTCMVLATQLLNIVISQCMGGSKKPSRKYHSYHNQLMTISPCLKTLYSSQINTCNHFT